MSGSTCSASRSVTCAARPSPSGALLKRLLPDSPDLRLWSTPTTYDADIAARWLDELPGGGADGVVAKRADEAYHWSRPAWWGCGYARC